MTHSVPSDDDVVGEFCCVCISSSICTWLLLRFSKFICFHISLFLLTTATSTTTPSATTTPDRATVTMRAMLQTEPADILPNKDRSGDEGGSGWYGVGGGGSGGGLELFGLGRLLGGGVGSREGGGLSLRGVCFWLFDESCFTTLVILLLLYSLVSY